MVTSFSFHPEGRLLLALDEQSKAMLWDLSPDRFGKPPKGLPGWSDQIRCASFDAGGRRLVLVDWDWTVRAWTLNVADPGATMRVIPGRSPARGANTDAGESPIQAAVSHDGRWAAVGCKAELRVWDLDAPDPAASERRLPHKDQWLYDLNFSPDGRWLAWSGPSTVRLWRRSASDGPEPRILTGLYKKAGPLRFSPDSRWLLTTSYFEDSERRSERPRHDSRIWDLRLMDPSTSPIVLGGPTDHVVGIGTDPFRIATAGAESKVSIWELDEGVRARLPSSSPAKVPRSIRSPSPPTGIE